MRNLFRDHILAYGGIFHDLDDILVGRFDDVAMARRCAADIADLCRLTLVEAELADEWLWLFLPPILLEDDVQTRLSEPAKIEMERFQSRYSQHHYAAKTAKTIQSVEHRSEPWAQKRRLKSDRTFCLYDPICRRTDWLFDSREGMHGPFPSKAAAELALAEFIETCIDRKADGGRNKPAATDPLPPRSRRMTHQ